MKVPCLAAKVYDEPNDAYERTLDAENTMTRPRNSSSRLLRAIRW